MTDLHSAIQATWGTSTQTEPKVRNYVKQFRNRQRLGDKLSAVVTGNHGDYTVSIVLIDGRIQSACSCYVGKGGGCHHCAALAVAFLTAPDSFVVVEQVALSAVSDLDSLETYLKSVTLDDLMKQLRKQGITQKAFCESIGMTSRHLSAVKSSEKRNRHYHELVPQLYDFAGLFLWPVVVLTIQNHIG